MIARFFLGAKKHGIYSVLATFGEKRVLRFGSWLGWAPGGLPGAILEASGALRDRFWALWGSPIGPQNGRKSDLKFHTFFNPKKDNNKKPGYHGTGSALA